MPAVPAPGPDVLSAAFILVFRQGRSPPSCPSPHDSDLLNRIRDAVPQASPPACREALVRVRRLSFDALEIGTAFGQGLYGEGEDAKSAAIRELNERDPGFSEAEYRTAFSVGLIWAAL